MKQPPRQEKNRTVLLVEDDSPVREAALFELKKRNIPTDIAIDGEEALQKLAQKNYDVLLLDLLLPKVNGFEIIKEVRKNPTQAFLKIIVMSNLGQESDIKHAIELGANEYYIKADTTIHELIEKITQ